MTLASIKVLLRYRPRPEHLARLAEIKDVELLDCTNDDAFARNLSAADAIVLSGRIDAGMIAAAPHLRWVQFVNSGVDTLPLHALQQRGVQVTNFRGVPASNIAEHVIGLMLAFARGLPELLARQSRREWRPQADAPATFDLAGQRLCLLGYGQIGRAIAWRASGLGMEVWAMRQAPSATQDGAVRLVGPSQLAELLAGADHLALSLPLTTATRGMLDAPALAQLRPSAYLYNVGRGALIDQAALVGHLTAGKLAGAGLDVTDPEPLPKDSPLWAMPNVIITSHTSGPTSHYWERGTAIITENLRRFTQGEALLNLVDLAAGY